MAKVLLFFGLEGSWEGLGASWGPRVDFNRFVVDLCLKGSWEAWGGVGVFGVREFGLKCLPELILVLN